MIADKTINIKSAQEIWGISDANMVVVNQEAERFKIKHGMFASIPLICRGHKCPYSESCHIPDGQRTIGERCFIEIGAIISRFDSWCKHFDVDVSDNFVKDEDLVDAMLIRDLIDIEIQIIRAENKLAINGDFIGEELAEVDKQGKPWFNNVVTPEAEYKLSLYDKRQKVLNQLNATRKDKATSIKNGGSNNEVANTVFNQIKEQMKANKIDLDNIDEDGDE